MQLINIRIVKSYKISCNYRLGSSCASCSIFLAYCIINLRVALSLKSRYVKEHWDTEGRYPYSDNQSTAYTVLQYWIVSIAADSSGCTDARPPSDAFLLHPRLLRDNSRNDPEAEATVVRWPGRLRFFSIVVEACAAAARVPGNARSRPTFATNRARSD